MKMRKMFAALCATAMLLSAMPVSAAAPAEKLSEYAGKTMRVMVCADDREEDKVIEVAIPVDSTEMEEQKLVSNASYKAIYGHRRAATVEPRAQALLGGLKNAVLTASVKTLIEFGPLDKNYSYVEITIDNMQASGGATHLDVQASNYKTGQRAQQSTSVASNVERYVYFFSGKDYNGGTISLTEGETVYFMGNVNAGRVTCNMLFWGYE